RSVRALTLVSPFGRAQGMPGALLAPTASRAVEERHASKDHHRSSRITRHSLRDGFNGFLRALLGDQAFLSPSAAKEFRDLDANPGASGPHDFSVRDSQARRARPPRPSHSNPTLVTAATRPSIRVWNKTRT